MIVLNGLTLGYGDTLIVDHLDYTFPPVSAIALMGASGAGKTTLLKALGGLLRPLKGSITGIGKTSFLFQEDRLLPWCTALKNAALSGDEETARVFLQQLGMMEMGRLPSALSGGMRRRVALARTLCYPADFLLLDEPFKGLDEETKARAMRVILDTRKPVIFTTHEPSEAENMDAAVIRMEELAS